MRLRCAGSRKRWRARAATLAALLALLSALPVGARQVSSSECRWIAASPDRAENQPLVPDTAPLPIFRRAFTLVTRPTAAILRISGLGQYEAHINGRNVTPAVLTPGWTLYSKHVLFDSYDVLPLLQPGPNAIAVLLGNGMYHVPPAPGRYAKFEGSFGQLKLIAEITLRFADGHTQTIDTDASWKTGPGPITFSHEYGGEDFDARLEPAGWETAGFDDSTWAAATPVQGPGGELIAETTPPIEAFQTFEPVKVTHPKPGLTVYDLGQNFSGWPEIAVTGPRGVSVKLIAGELLTPDGLVTQHSGGARPDAPNVFAYTLRGGSTAAHPETWHPRFSYYGFRYVQAEASAPELRIIHLDGRFLHASAEQTGSFTSSDPLFNRIHALIDRAMLSNMMSVLTDCPQREKLGWLEQTHLAGAALMYNWNLASLYNQIAGDIGDSQQANGLVPDIAPEFTVFSGPFRDSPEWGSAVVLSAWVAYQFSGDPEPLRQHFRSMQRYVAYLGTRASNHLLDFGLGDWYDIGPGEPGISKLTTPGLVPSAIYFEDLTKLARIAELLGQPSDATRYAGEAAAVKQALNAKYFHPETNQYDRGSQTANAMPLVAGLVPEGHEAAVLANLVADIRAHQNHVTAGDVGFHYVVRALTDGGRSDVLFDMLSRTDAPSYGDQLARGATALTEAWDANPNSSQNHFMLGHAEEWFYRGLAGIQFDRSRSAPAEQLRIAPAVVGGLTSVFASFKSSLGVISSAWRRRSASALTLTMDVTLPADGKILFPPNYRASILLDGHPLETDRRVIHANLANDTPHAYLHAGRYHFTLRKSAGESAARERAQSLPRKL